MEEPETRNLQDIIIEDQEKINQKTLAQIASLDSNAAIVDDLMSRDIPTQLKAFTLAKAKSDLIRVLKVGAALDELEDSFIERALNDKDEASLKQLASWIETLKGSQDRAYNLIQKVMGDQSINMTINQSMNIFNDNSTTNNTQNNTNNFVSVLSDKRSRQKIRDIASKLLSTISTNPSEIVDSPISEVEPEE